MTGPGSSIREQLAAGATYSFAVLVVTKAVLIVNSIAIARVLGPADQGVWAIFGSLLGVAMLLSTLNVPNAAVKLLSEEGGATPNAMRKITSAGLILTGVGSGIVGIALVIVAPILSESVFGEPRLALLLVASTIVIVASAFPSALFATFQAMQKIRAMSWFGIISSTLSVPITVIFVVQYGLIGALVGLILTTLVGLFVGLVLLFRTFPSFLFRPLVPDRETIKRIVNYSIPSVAAALSYGPIILIASTFLVVSHSFHELGTYSVAQSFSSYLMFIPMSISVPLIPMVSRLSSMHAARLPGVLEKALRGLILLTLPATLILIVGSDMLIGLLYGIRYAESVVLLRILAIGAFLLAVSSLVGFAIAGTGKMWHGLGLNLAWSAVFLVLAAVLTGPLAARGMALAYAGAYGFHSVTSLIYAQRALRMKLTRVKGITAAASILILTAIAIVLFLDGWTEVTAGVVLVVTSLELERRLMTPDERTLALQQLGRILRPFHKAPGD